MRVRERCEVMGLRTVTSLQGTRLVVRGATQGGAWTDIGEPVAHGWPSPPSVQITTNPAGVSSAPRSSDALEIVVCTSGAKPRTVSLRSLPGRNEMQKLLGLATKELLASA